jgi:hypothetical protein
MTIEESLWFAVLIFSGPLAFAWIMSRSIYGLEIKPFLKRRTPNIDARDTGRPVIDKLTGKPMTRKEMRRLINSIRNVYEDSTHAHPSSAPIDFWMKVGHFLNGFIQGQEAEINQRK